MAESSWPTGAGARVVTDPQYEVLGRAFTGDGVLQGASDTAVVYGDSSGRQVKVRASKQAYLRGYGWDSGLTESIETIAANASGSTRYDVVVLRFTRSTLAVTVEIVQGTGGAGVPAVTQTAGTTGVWEMPLAVVTVANGASTITAGNVSDVAPLLAPTGGVVVRSLTALGYAFVSPVQGMRVHVIATNYDVVYSGAVWVPVAGSVLVRANRGSPTGSTTSEIGVVRLAVGTVYSVMGCVIKTSGLLVGCDSGAATVGVNVRYTTDGSTPSTSSTLLTAASQAVYTPEGAYQGLVVSGLYLPSGTESLSVLLTLTRRAGTGNVWITQAFDLWIESTGVIPADAGVDL